MTITNKYQGDEERLILTALIVSDRVAGRLFTHLKNEKRPFSSKWSNLIAQWGLAHFGKYNKAPRQTIKALFGDFAQTSQDTDTVDLLEEFLTSLSRDYKTLAAELNEDYVIDLAARYFNKVKMARLCESVGADLEVNKTTEAEKRVLSFHPLKLATTSIVDVLTDDDALRDALAPQENNVLIQYPGALGEFYGPQFCKDSFIVYLAPEKRGKSFMLIDAAWRAAVRNKRRTLFYSVGDMSQDQMMRRFVTRAAQRTIHPAVVFKPVRLERLAEKMLKVETTKVEFNESLSFGEAKKIMETARVNTAHTDSLLKLRCTPNGTTSIADINVDCDELAREGWIPQVIVLDYMDILAPEPGSGSEEIRNRININWQAARRLSQERHCNFISATQADAASYNKNLLGMDNFSEDKRKWAHVTGGVGINQTAEEKERGLFRLNWIVLREGAFQTNRVVTVAGSLALASPCMISI